MKIPRFRLPPSKISQDLIRVLVLAAFVGGCARGLIQPLPTVPAGDAASVTLTRESTMVGAALSYIVTVDDQEVVALRAGEQYTIPVAAGERTIGVKCLGRAMGSLAAQLDAGKQYYFRLGPSVANCATIRKVTPADLPPVELKLDFATPADVESKLFGDAGLVRGARRFQAEFERMILTSEDAWRLRAFIKGALAAPAGSKLKFAGTINGTKFEAKMEKNKADRARVQFEGLAFQNEQEMEDFLAPFPTERLEELKLHGSVAGRPIEVKR